MNYKCKAVIYVTQTLQQVRNPMPSLSLTPFCLVEKGCHLMSSLSMTLTVIMSSAETQTRGSEAKHIRLPTHAHQHKTAPENPCASYRVKKQTVPATPNPLPAEQAESVSSNKRGHQQLEGRTLLVLLDNLNLCNLHFGACHYPSCAGSLQLMYMYTWRPQRRSRKKSLRR